MRLLGWLMWFAFMAGALVAAAIVLAIMYPLGATELTMTREERIEALLKMDDYCLGIGGCKLIPISEFERYQREVKALREAACI